MTTPHLADIHNAKGDVKSGIDGNSHCREFLYQLQLGQPGRASQLPAQLSIKL